MIQNEKVNIYYGSKDAYDFEKQNKRIDENALYFIEGVLYSGYELYSQDYKKVSSYPSIGHKNYIYINTTDSSVAIWDDDKNEWVYLSMPVSNEIIDDNNSIATSAVVYKVLQDTREYTNEVSKILIETMETTIEDVTNAINNINSTEDALKNSIEEEENRATTAENEIKDIIETNKPIWDDKYTKVEIDDKFYNISSQNTFSNVVVGTTTISADEKTDTLELVAGDNVTITPDTTNDKITFDIYVQALTEDETDALM